MADQADKLRQLLTTAPTLRDGESTLNVVAVTGGRAGVGTTTVAVNLAAALANFGQRVLVVDASDNRDDMLRVAGVRRRAASSLADVVDGKCGVADALQPGPLGTEFLAGGSRRYSSEFSRQGEQRLLAALNGVSSQFDVFVIDTGRGLLPWARRVWLRSRLTVVVTTTNKAALMDSYAMLKHGVTGSVRPQLGMLINRIADDSIAAEVQRRFSNSCQRFLSLNVAALPSLPSVEQEGVDAGRRPRLWEQPDSAFGHAALWIGRAVGDLMDNRIQDTAYGEGCLPTHAVLHQAFRNLR